MGYLGLHYIPRDTVLLFCFIFSHFVDDILFLILLFLAQMLGSSFVARYPVRCDAFSYDTSSLYEYITFCTFHFHFLSVSIFLSKVLAI
jgi:hypothetical protein